MTDNEIVKALECCGDDECSKCPLQDGVCSEKDVIKQALDLINRQKAEIERLSRNYVECGKMIKAEAYKEFAETVILQINEYIEHQDNSTNEGCKVIEYLKYLICDVKDFLKQKVGEQVE